MITNFFKPLEPNPRRPATVRPPPGRVVAAFDNHGFSLTAWRESGYTVSSDGMLLDLGQTQVEAFVSRNAGATFAVAVPPCTDLSNAGARWWKKKKAANPRFQQDAKEGLQRLFRALERLGCPFVILTPAGGKIRGAFNEINAKSFVFDPCDYGGHLDSREEHPKWPSIVPRSDAYKKRTLAVLGGGARRPTSKPVKPTFSEITVKKKGVSKTRLVCPLLASRKDSEARHVAPRGFCRAVALCNMCHE